MDAATLGRVALWGAVAAGTVSALPLLGARARSWARGAMAALAATSVVALAAALVAVDLSLEYVASTTSRATPWHYRLAGVWGGMEGSMLFYAAMTAAVVAVAFRRGRHGPVPGVIGSAAAALMLAFATIMVDPFVTAPIPEIDGDGLLAILQHPAMIYHPPLLYLGLTTLVVPFAMAAGGGANWLSPARRWLWLSWTVLTLGMLAGSAWAYVELGWGGFWAWDPVENTSLMPWLAATGFLHTSTVLRASGRLRRSTTALAMAPFALSVLGIYLTRSGVTGSIHSFAEDPAVGRVLLVAAAVAAAAVIVVASRAAAGEPWSPPVAPLDAWQAAAGGILAGALMFVLVGTAYPAYANVFFGSPVAVEPAFFLTFAIPIALLASAGMALGPDGAPSKAGVLSLAAAIGLALLAWLVLAGAPRPLLAGLVGAVSAGAALIALRGLLGSGRVVAHLAHLGMLLVILGSAGSAHGSEVSGPLSPGESVEVGGHVLTLLEITSGEAGRYQYVRAVFDAGGTRIEPEVRAYEDQSLPVAEPDLHREGLTDIVASVSLVFPEARSVDVTVFVRPLVSLVWFGAVLLVAAGVAGILGRGGVASGRRRRARGVPQPAGTTSGRSAL